MAVLAANRKKSGKQPFLASSKVSLKSSKKYVIAGLGYRLTDNGIMVLKELADGLSQAEIAKKTPLTKKGVNYWVKKLVNFKCVKVLYEGRPQYYRITPLGLALLTRSETTSFCLLEDYPSKYPLIADHSNIAWEKLGQPQNWIKLGFKVGDITVVKTSQNVIIHTGQIAGKSELACAEHAGAIKYGVKAWLQSHGVLMGDVPVDVKKPMFQFFSKEAEILHEHFGNVVTEDGKIDNSPHDNDPKQRIPHEEYDRQTAINKIGEANTIARIECKLDNLINITEKLTDSVLKLANSADKTETPKPVEPLREQPLRDTNRNGMYM